MIPADADCDAILARHRDVWRSRLFFAVAYCLCAGAILGYLLAKWVG